MAAEFAALPSKVLWRLTAKEVPDEAAMAALELGNNTQVLANMSLPDRCPWSGNLQHVNHIRQNMPDTRLDGKELTCKFTCAKDVLLCAGVDVGPPK